MFCQHGRLAKSHAKDLFLDTKQQAWINSALCCRGWNQKSKVGLCLCMWLLVQRSANNPGFPDNGHDVISLNMEKKSLSRSRKQAYVSLYDRLCRVRQTTLVFLTKGWLRRIVPVVEVCEVDHRFRKAKLGALNRSNAAKFWKNWNTLRRSHPFVWRSFVWWRSFMWWSVASPSIIVFAGDREPDVISPSGEAVVPTGSLQRTCSNVSPGRLLPQSILFENKEPHVISLNMTWIWMDMKSLTRSIVEVCEVDHRFWKAKLETLNRSIAATSWKNWNALQRSHAFLYWRSFVRRRSFMRWSIAQPSIVFSSGTHPYSPGQQEIFLERTSFDAHSMQSSSLGHTLWKTHWSLMDIMRPGCKFSRSLWETKHWKKANLPF